MPTKKRLILHLGLPRTGTTSIQSFLRGNDSALRNLGIWYPAIDPQRYVTIAGQADDLRKKTILANLSRGLYHEILAMAVGESAVAARRRGFQIGLDVWLDFLDAFERGECHTAIVSFEGFGAAPHHHALSALGDALSRFDCEGIIYHRSYDSWVRSLFEQYVRGKGRFGLDFEQLLQQAHVKLYPFTHRVAAIKKSLLLEKVTVRSFEAAARNDRLLEDFFQALDLHEAWTRLAHTRRPRANVALSPSQTLFLYQLNLWGVPDESFIEARQAFSRKRQAGTAAEPCSIVPAASLERLRSMAAAEADSLRTAFGIEPIPAPPPAAPLPHRLGRERFQAMIEGLSDAIGPGTRAEWLRRSAELEP